MADSVCLVFDILTSLIVVVLFSVARGCGMRVVLIFLLNDSRLPYLFYMYGYLDIVFLWNAVHMGPTACLCLLNAVNPRSLYDENFYDELLEDMQQECSRFGTVVQIKIPRPPTRKQVRRWKVAQRKRIKESENAPASSEQEDTGSF